MGQTDLSGHEGPQDFDIEPEDRPRLLVVDDDREIRLLLRKLTERSDFHVIAEADDGEEAVSLASSYQPDAILLDVSMPVMDGLEALPWLTLLPWSPRAVTIRGRAEVVEQPTPAIRIHTDRVVSWGLDS